MHQFGRQLRFLHAHPNRGQHIVQRCLGQPGGAPHRLHFGPVFHGAELGDQRTCRLPHDAAAALAERSSVANREVLILEPDAGAGTALVQTAPQGLEQIVFGDHDGDLIGRLEAGLRLVSEVGDQGGGPRLDEQEAGGAEEPGQPPYTLRLGDQQAVQSLLMETIANASKAEPYSAPGRGRRQRPERRCETRPRNPSR